MNKKLIIVNILNLLRKGSSGTIPLHSVYEYQQFMDIISTSKECKSSIRSACARKEILRIANKFDFIGDKRESSVRFVFRGCLKFCHVDRIPGEFRRKRWHK